MDGVTSSYILSKRHHRLVTLIALDGKLKLADNAIVYVFLSACEEKIECYYVAQ